MQFALCIACLHAPPASAEEVGEGIIQSYRKALEINPSDMDARYFLGVALLRERSHKEALTHLLIVYPSRSGEAEINYSIGLAYAGAGELQNAFRYYSKVEEINPAEAKDKYKLDMVFYNLGIAYRKEGNLDEALKVYQVAIRINPEQENAYCTKGEILYQKKDYNNALESLTTCREKNPEWKGLNRLISVTYQERGIEQLNQKNYAGARAELDNAVNSDPTNEPAHYYTGYLEYLTGNYRKAISALDKIKKTEREDMKKILAKLFYNIGAAMQKNEDWEGAITALSQAIEIDSAEPELHFYLGYSYTKTKKPDLAMAAFKEALRLNPKHQKAALNLAAISDSALRSHLEKGSKYLQSNSCAEALGEFNSALSIDPRNQWAMENKQSAERCAKQLAAEALRKREQEIALKLSEGNKFIAAKKYLEAKKSFDAVLTLEPGNQTAGEGIKQIAEFIKLAKERHLAAGENAFADGKYYIASVEFKKALMYDPDDKALSEKHGESLKRLSEQTSPLLKEAQEHEDSRRLAEAISAYEKVIGIQPGHKGAIEGKARASGTLEKTFNEALSEGRKYARAGDLQKAAENYRVALELRPANDIAMAELKAISGRLQNVIADRLAGAASALKAGRYGEAMSNYKAILLIDRENKEAAAGIQNAARLRTEIVDKKMVAGLKAYKEDNYPQAISLFSDVLLVDPGNAEAQRLQKEARSRIDESITPWLKSGIEAYKRGDVDAAIVSFKKVLNVDPGNREAREYMGKVDVQKTKASVGKEVEKHYLKGIELYTEGKYREAMESWKKVLELDPRHEKSLLNIEKAKRKMEGVMDTK